MKLSIKVGATSQTINVFVQDSSSTTGAGLTGLVFNTSSLVAYYALPRAAAVQITLATLAAVTSAFSSGGFKEIDATNMPGWYRLDLPDAALASGRFVSVHLKGAANMAPLPLEIELTGWDNQDAVHGGLSGIPNAAAGASGGLLISGSNSGTTTLAALTVTGALTVSDGIAVSRSTSNTSAITATGNGTGSGIVATSGSGATGDGIKGVAASTNGNGISAAGVGTGDGLVATGGATGRGFHGVGGATSGAGMKLEGTAGNAIALELAGQGSAAGLQATGGATGPAAKLVGGGTSGDGLMVTTTSGHGLNVAATGASKHGATFTGGNSGTSDGVVMAAGTGGVDLRANQTGNITGNLSGSVGSIASGGISEASYATTAGSFAPLGIADQGTAQAATSTTLQLRSAAAFADNELAGAVVWITGGSAGVGQARSILSNVGSTDTVTVDAWNTTPTGTITYKVLAAPPAPAAVPQVDVIKWNGTAVSVPTVAGVPNVNAKTWNDLATVALPLVPTTAGRTLDVSAGGEAGVDWANVGSPTTTLALTGTTIATTQKVDIETIKTQAVTAAAGVTFPASIASPTNITAATGVDVTKFGGTTITSASGVPEVKVQSIANNALTAAAINADAFTAAKFAADVTTELQAGLATASALTSVAGDVTAVKAVTTKVATTLEPFGSPSQYIFTQDALSRAPSGSGASAAAIADAVWDELIAGHAISGSTGQALSAAGAAGDPWITALPGSYTAGQAGYVIGHNIDAVLSSRASQTSVDTVAGYVDTEVSAIKTKTDQLTFTVSNQVDVNVVDWKGSAAPAMTGDAFARLGAPAGASVSADVAAVKVDTAAVKVQTDKMVFTVTNHLDVNALKWNGLTTVALPLVPTTAGRTLDVSAGGEAGLDWANVGSPTTVVGLSGTTVKTATDVETDTQDIQSRLPAALVSGRIDASVGAMAANTMTAAAAASDLTTELQAGLATAAALTSAAGDITAVKAKTDNLPSDPADASDVAGAFSTVNSTLATIAGYIDTEVAAIKAKTDNLPAAPAAVGDIPTAAANAAALLGAAVEGAITVVQSLRLTNAALGGKADGMATTTIHLRDLGDTKNRITATVDADGNRSAVSRDLT